MRSHNKLVSSRHYSSCRLDTTPRAASDTAVDTVVAEVGTADNTDHIEAWFVCSLQWNIAFSLVLHSGVASSWINVAMAGVNCWLISGAGGVIISGVGKASDGGTNSLKSASRLKSGWPGLAPCQSGIEKYGLCLLVLLMRMGDVEVVIVENNDFLVVLILQ
ncbi:hypothetical protein Tco_0848125 [Tanacetum coccineum]